MSIFEISSVNVPTEPGEDNNNRTRLVTLARELVMALQGKGVCLACIIDSDFDYISDYSENNAFLLTTDYANMEMYFFNSSIMGKLNNQCLAGEGITSQMIDSCIVPILQSLFRIRYVNSNPEWQMEDLSFERLLSFGGSHLDFNYDEYIKRYLNKNKRFSELVDFHTEIDAVSIPSGFDTRCFIHGHDFLTLLRWVINNMPGRSKYRDNELVFILLKACADYTALAQEKMFTTIISRFGQESNNGIDNDH